MKVFKFFLCSGGATGGRLVQARDVFEAKEKLEKILKESVDPLDRSAKLMRWEECEYVDKVEYLEEVPVSVLSTAILRRFKHLSDRPIGLSELIGFLESIKVDDGDLFSECIEQIQSSEVAKSTAYLLAMKNGSEAHELRRQLTRKLTWWERLTGRIKCGSG